MNPTDYIFKPASEWPNQWYDRCHDRNADALEVSEEYTGSTPERRYPETLRAKPALIDRIEAAWGRGFASDIREIDLGLLGDEYGRNEDGSDDRIDRWKWLAIREMIHEKVREELAVRGYAIGYGAPRVLDARTPADFRNALHALLDAMKEPTT